MKVVPIRAHDVFEVGDFVALKNKSGYYMIYEMEKHLAEEGDYWVRWRKFKVGETVRVSVKILKLLNADLSKPKRTKSSSYLSRLVKIDRDFIKSMFKKLNDTLMMTVVFKERGELYE